MPAYVGIWLPLSPRKGLIDPVLHVICSAAVALPWPMPEKSERVASTEIIGKPRRNQTRIVLCFVMVRMGRQQNSQEATSRVHVGIAQRSSDFPVHVLALPSARANQHYCYGGLGNMLPPDSPQRIRCGWAVVRNVANVDRPIHNLVNHHPFETICPLLIVFVIVADEYLVPFSLRHL